jgi:diguanylate cyclase (GGDEF)-like protein/PAS domain S-box-containing protein
MIKGLYQKKKPTVLIVDDSRLERMYIANYLKSEGYEVIEADNGRDGVMLYEQIKPNVVLLDYVMPNMDGLEACLLMRSLPNWTSSPVFMITSVSDESSVTKAYESGAADYITKPVNLAVLKQRINKAIESQELLMQLNHSNAFSQSIINYAVEGIITIDGSHSIKYANPSLLDLLGYTLEELLKLEINEIVPNCNVNDVIHHEDSHPHGDDAVELWCVDKLGMRIPIELTVSHFVVDEMAYYTLILRDITERKLYEKRIKQQAFYDALTKLPNRILLKERISDEMNKCRRNGGSFALMYLDLDRFKSVNDSLGHNYGDEILKKMALRLKKSVREEDLVVRMGGDEFVIVLTSLKNAEYVGRIANNILSAIKKPIRIDENEIVLTVSIGITIYPDDGSEYETLLSNADIAMYRSKERGKNTFEIFTAELNDKALERLEMENSLRRAVEYNEFILHYQPKLDVKTSAIVGMEALVRWKSPKLGMVPPDKFIPLAEETGLIIPIGEWVLRTACMHTKAIHNAGISKLSVAVNLSFRQFELQNLCEIVTDILEETGLEPELLELEITESIAMKNVKYTVDVIKKLQSIGVKFSIDDFGTGYSSLGQLSSLSVNKLKIDKSFINMVNAQRDNTVIASTVLSLGKSLNMKVVAEGVENSDQVAFLKDSECDEMQGYFISRPVSVEEITKLIRDHLHT